MSGDMILQRLSCAGCACAMGARVFAMGWNERKIAILKDSIKKNISMSEYRVGEDSISP